MFTHLLGAFRSLFTSRDGRAEVAGLILVMAAVPVVEMLVIRMFSDLIIHGPQLLETQRGEVLRDSLVFFLAFALARVVHHGVRIHRVRVFARRFAQADAGRSPSQESWSWALAFELSNVLASVVQIAAFGLLFLYLDLVTGVVNLVVSAAVLLVISWFYRRQLSLQHGYVLAGNKVGTPAVAERVGTRIRSAESGALVSSVGLALVLVAVLWRTLQGEVSGSDAVVFFLALRLSYGQIGTLSSGVMRFARASARTAAGH